MRCNTPLVGKRCNTPDSPEKTGRLRLKKLTGATHLNFMKTEPTTNLNISGVPVALLKEIDKISDIRSKAVVTLLKEALEARKKKGNRQ